MAMQLAAKIHRNSDDRFLISRFCRSLKTVTKEKGCLKGGTMAAATTAATICSLAISYFCMEGTVRTLMSIGDYEDHVVGLRPLGDAGGWTALTVFSVMALESLFSKLSREGEYLRLVPICQKWMKENKEWILENPKFQKRLYALINDLLDDFSAQCLFSKRVVSRRLTALKIYKKTDLKRVSSKHKMDKKLQNIYREIQSELKKTSSVKKYFHKLYEGQKSIGEGGCSKQISSLVCGVALPLIFLVCALSSIIGEIGLGKELFGDREDLEDTGHFGEWPFNAIEVIGAAFLFHLWYMINEGDFALTKNVYAKHIEDLKDRPKLHNRLCDIANEELSRMSRRKLPLEYKFEKL